MDAPYLPPLDRLLTLGEEPARQRDWPDYLALGFTREHVPELIRMATDEELAMADCDSDEVWGGLHAWRTLGQLGAEAAVAPLVVLLEWADDSDWVHEELPKVFGMIGPAALEPLRAALSRHSLDSEPWTAASAANGLVEIAQRHPEARQAAVDALTGQLRWWARQDPELNAMLIHDLVEVKAVEAAPLMEEAFAADAVEISYMGDWEDVQIELGLLAERVTPPPQWFFTRPPRKTAWAPANRPPAAKGRESAKRRRKAEKASRRRNRKRR
jgi:HEAT repeat protein